jgi:hypothetical protein
VHKLPGIALPVPLVNIFVCFIYLQPIAVKNNQVHHIKVAQVKIIVPLIAIWRYTLGYIAARVRYRLRFSSSGAAIGIGYHVIIAAGLQPGNVYFGTARLAKAARSIPFYKLRPGYII